MFPQCRRVGHSHVGPKIATWKQDGVSYRIPKPQQTKRCRSSVYSNILSNPGSRAGLTGVDRQRIEWGCQVSLRARWNMRITPRARHVEFIRMLLFHWKSQASLTILRIFHNFCSFSLIFLWLSPTSLPLFLTMCCFFFQLFVAFSFTLLSLFWLLEHFCQHKALQKSFLAIIGFSKSSKTIDYINNPNKFI